MTKCFTEEELAQRWNISEGTLANWRSEGTGPLFIKLKGTVRYREQDIVAYEAECLRKSTSERVLIGGVA